MNALLNIGVAYSRLKQYDKAISSYGKALAIKPDFLKANINMADLYMNQKKYDKALPFLKQAVFTAPKNTKVLYNLGISQFRLKKYEIAALTFKKIVTINPELPNPQLNLAILYYQYLNRQKESILHFKKALELNPNVQNKKQIQKIVKKWDSSTRWTFGLTGFIWLDLYDHLQTFYLPIAALDIADKSLTLTATGRLVFFKVSATTKSERMIEFAKSFT